MKTPWIVAFQISMFIAGIAAGYNWQQEDSEQEHRAALVERERDYERRLIERVEWISCHWLMQMTDEQLKAELERRRASKPTQPRTT